MSINQSIDGLGIPDNEFVSLEKQAIQGDEVIQANKGFDIISFLKDIVFTDSGPDGDYVSHPMNFAKSEGLGQAIQGITGYARKFMGVDSLKLAILDIIFGLLKFSRENKVVK